MLLRHPRSKRYTLSITWEMSRECWLHDLRYLCRRHWSWQSPLWKSSTVVESFPDFLLATTNLMTNNSGKLFNIQTFSKRKYQHLFLVLLSFNAFQKKRFFWKESRDKTHSSLVPSGLKLYLQPRWQPSPNRNLPTKNFPPNLLKLNLVFATLQLTQLVTLQRDWNSYKLESTLLQTLF